MLSDIYNALVSIVNFIKMEWEHVVDFFQFLGESMTYMPKFFSYLPSFFVPFASLLVTILFVKLIVNR